ncbi:MAG: folylpolyglutamate synthase/dihydrofolate synthase family protein [Deltaproteobacteria bacterium]
MDYQATVDWLFRLEKRLGMDLRLERLGPVLEELGHPQRCFAAAHVAGTNGKGSTAAMLARIYHGAGYRTGLYTSPHLLSFRERIRVDEGLIEEALVVEHTTELRRAMEKSGESLTFFEMATLMAFLEFRRQGVEIAVMEVGLGGRLDATNVVESFVTAITSVSLDHTAQLGNSIASIAREKAGIVKAGVPLISGPLPAEAQAVVGQVTAHVDSPWHSLGRDFGPWPTAPGLAGRYQADNAAVAAALVRAGRHRFPVSDGQIAEGLARVRWPGRLERVAESPAVLLDAAHNPAAVAALVEAIGELGLARPLVLVFGVMMDKDWQEMLCSLLPVCDQAVLVPVEVERSLDPNLMRGLAGCDREVGIAPSALVGLEQALALATPDGSVLITGSAFLVAELYQAAGGCAHPFSDHEKI